MKEIQLSRLPFRIARVYYLYDIPSGSERGGHAHGDLEEFLIPLSGSFTLRLQKASGETRDYRMDRPNRGLHIPPLLWHELHDFSANTVCLGVVSDLYSEQHYFRDFAQFVSAAQGQVLPEFPVFTELG